MPSTKTKVRVCVGDVQVHVRRRRPMNMLWKESYCKSKNQYWTKLINRMEFVFIQ